MKLIHKTDSEIEIVKVIVCVKSAIEYLRESVHRNLSLDVTDFYFSRKTGWLNKSIIPKPCALRLCERIFHAETQSTQRNAIDLNSFQKKISEFTFRYP
jgi:hypothetical protein